MNYYINQSEDNINKMLVGMSTIINGIDYQTEFLENQTWLQRIMKTITGQNKVTKEEIKKNYEKLTLYMVEIVQELYKKNVISYQFLFNLNSNLNKLYLEQNKLFENFIDFKEYFKKTIVKLNDKIESIDNFYMLNEEIKQGKYEGMYPIFILCDIISNLIIDKQTFEHVYHDIPKSLLH